MHVTTRLRFLTVLAALGVFLAIPATAFAYAPTGDDFITCVAGGDNEVECVAGIFVENCPVGFEATIVADGEVIGSGTAIADSDGEVDFDFTVPEDQEDGEVQVSLRCDEGEPKVLQDVIANIEDGEVIANAGFDSMTLLGIGAGALALGAGVLVISRRRSSGA